MKYKVYLFIAVFFLAVGMQFAYGTDKHSEKEWKTFEGAWFKIMYPADFRVEPSLKSITNVEGHDSVFFVSPSNKIVFYVFSPQWNGNPSDILLKQVTEKILSSKENDENGKKVRQCSIVAKDGSYNRTYEDIQDLEVNTRRVFGIRFADQETFDKYKEQYEYFQNSLVQFAD